MIDAEKSSHSVKSGPQSERSQCGNSKAGGSHKSQNIVKSGGEKNSGNAGPFGFGKFFGFGKNGGEKGPKPCSKKSHSERGGETVREGSMQKGSSRKNDFHGSEVARSAARNSSACRSRRGGNKKSSKKSQTNHHSENKASQVDDIPLVHDHETSVGRSSSIGGSKKGGKTGPMSHHSGEKRSQMGDPYNQQDLPMTAMMKQQRGAYYDAPHRPMSPPPRHRESYEHYFSDENANGCNIM